MEVEEKSNRNHSFSSDMMSTIRDDPEKYREMLRDLTKKKQQQQQQSSPAPKQVSTPAAAAPPPPPPPPPAPVANVGRPAAPPVAGYNQWQAAPPAPQSNSKRNLILGISIVALVAIIVALLFVFKVI